MTRTTRQQQKEKTQSVGHTNIIHGEGAFDQLSDQWDALAQRGMTDTPFQSLAYQRAWWTHLQPEGGSLHTIAVTDDEETLIGIACFYLLEGMLYFNGCVEETDYLDLITTASHAETVWTAVLDALCTNAFPAWEGLNLCNIPAASPTRSILPQEAARRGFSFTETVHEVCPIITLPETFEGYLSSIDSKQRREIQRKLRRANGADAQLVIVGPEDDIETAVDDFLDLLQKSTFEKRDWLTPGRRAVFHDTAKAAQANGTLQLMFMEVNSRKAAALFNFDYRNRIWVYNSGLDPDSFGALSLGVVITAKAIETAVESGRELFDFLRGNESYKYRFGAQDTEIFKHVVKR